MNHALFFLLFLMSLMMQRVMAQTTTTWTGSAWSDGNPDANKDVVISSGTFTTSINSNFHCKNLTIHSGATLEVLAGDTFSVSGVVTNDGTLTNNGYLILRSCGKYSVTDVDGNSYATVQIGTQCWTQSNLRVSKYRDGSSITNITDNTQWSQTNTSSTGAWCDYNNNASNGTTYGKLYNWYAVNDSRGLCPTGWHVPTDDEWTILTDHLGDTTMAGGKMKNTTGWNAPNTSASNASAFTALPGGFRGNGGNFSRVGNYGYWWSTSDTNTGTAWLRGLDYSDAIAERIHLDHRAGFSVRCLRDVAAVALPSVSTSSVTNITSVSAIAGGMVTAAGGGTVLARGVAYATSINPTLLGSFTYNGQGTGSYASTLSGLSASTTYYVRAYATNSVGTAYGAQVSFT
ncbi:MAG: fibrobacter succinogenes major paralogous domain-containing protein, partial [Bacteroidia bacterium]